MMHSLIVIIAALCITTHAIETRAIIRQVDIDAFLRELRQTSMDPILFWNLATLKACANDYDQSIAFKPDQDGPAATARAFAIIHGAMLESIKAFDRAYQQFTGSNTALTTYLGQRNYGIVAAITEAAYQTLSALYPQQRPIFDAVYAFELNQLLNGTGGRNEIIMGQTAGYITATSMIENRQTDGSHLNAHYIPIRSVGYHDVDPNQPTQGYVGSQWGKVKPFYLESASQFRPLNTVGETVELRAHYLNSSTYLRDFNEVKQYGARFSTARSPDQTHIGIAWAYDGVPKLGTPPRLYNQIVRTIAIQQRNTLEQNAKLFAFVNYAMADAAIAAWDTKYFYNFWRPILGIRRSPDIYLIDENWVPLGAPADGSGSDFTPPFPSFVSGHATMGTSAFQALRLFYNTDNIAFRFQSDEYNGKTVDSYTRIPRPALTRQYSTFTAAEEENALSRVYLGVHWRSDVLRGRNLGQQVASEVFRKIKFD